MKISADHFYVARCQVERHEVKSECSTVGELTAGLKSGSDQLCFPRLPNTLGLEEFEPPKNMPETTPHKMFGRLGLLWVNNF